MNYRISRQAHADIKSIWLYTRKNWSTEQADKYVHLIFDEIDFLANNPNSGKDFGLFRKQYRYSKVKSHIVFYRLSEEQQQIEIIRVLHQNMDLERHLPE